MQLDGFKPYQVSAGISTMTIGKTGISFSKTAVIRLDKAATVELLINDELKMLAIKPVDSSEDNATTFFRPGKKSVFVRWNFQDLIQRISEMMDWDVQKATYKVKGEFHFPEGFMTFDLKTAYPIK